MKLTKNLIAISAAISIGFSVAPAHASDTNLTAEQFQQSQSYKDYAAIAQHSDELWAADPGTTIHMTVDLQSIVSMRALDVTINATKDGSRTTISKSTQESQTVNFYDGKYYRPLENACNDFFSTDITISNPCVDEDYLGKVKNNLTNKNAKFVATTTSPLQSNTLDATPASIAQGNFSNPLYMAQTWLGLYELGTATFSELTSGPNTNDATQTDYKFSIQAKDQNSGTVTDVNVTQTISSAGKIIKTVVTETAKTQFFTMSVDVNVTQETWANPDLVAPNASEVITQSTFNKAGNKIIADVNAMRIGDSVVTKAKALAKKAKRSLDSSYLVSAAKAYKMKYVTIKNGIKIRSNHATAISYVCITVVKGKASTKTC